MDPFDRFNNRRKTARVIRLIGEFLLLSAALQLVGCLPGFLKDDKTEVATTIERSVVDLAEDPPRHLLDTNDDILTFHSEPIEKLLGPADGRLVINDMADAAIRKLFPQRAYVVKVRLCIERSTKTFIVDREGFNALRVGVIAKFVMNSNETAIDSLIAY